MINQPTVPMSDKIIHVKHEQSHADQPSNPYLPISQEVEQLPRQQLVIIQVFQMREFVALMTSLHMYPSRWWNCLVVH